MQIKDTDMPANPVLYRSRLAGKTVYSAGAEFDLEALPARCMSYVEAHARDDEGRRNGTYYALYMLSFGIKAVRGLKDENGADVTPEREDVTILGKTYSVFSIAFLEGLDAKLLQLLTGEVIALTNLSASDNLRLDFTPPSQPT